MEGEVTNLVREHRQRLGLTQGELAKAVGVSRQSINSIERGVYTPSLALALRLAREFECPTDEVFALGEQRWRSGRH